MVSHYEPSSLSVSSFFSASQNTRRGPGNETMLPPKPKSPCKHADCKDSSIPKPSSALQWGTRLYFKPCMHKTRGCMRSSCSSHVASYNQISVVDRTYNYIANNQSCKFTACRLTSRTERCLSTSTGDPMKYHKK